METLEKANDDVIETEKIIGREAVNELKEIEIDKEKLKQSEYRARALEKQMKIRRKSSTPLHFQNKS